MLQMKCVRNLPKFSYKTVSNQYLIYFGTNHGVSHEIMAFLEEEIGFSRTHIRDPIGTVSARGTALGHTSMSEIPVFFRNMR